MDQLLGSERVALWVLRVAGGEKQGKVYCVEGWSGVGFSHKQRGWGNKQFTAVKV